MAKLTEKSLATAVTLNSLIHIVNTGDTTQSAYGSSYKAELSQLVPLFGSNPDVTITGGTYNPSTGEVTFYNNTGGTFNVSGFITGFTDSFVSGGTYSSGTATFTNTTGGTFNVTGFTEPFTGGSSNCITDLYTSNIHSCSPLNVNPLDEGNVYFGSTSGITLDVVNSRIGIGTNLPQYQLEIIDIESKLYYDGNNNGGALILSGNTMIPRIAIETSPYLSKPSAGGSIGIRAWDDTTYPEYGKVGDMFLYAGTNVNGLNILNRQGTGMEDYIRFYAGQTASTGNTPDIHIQGTGTTRGYVGIGHTTPLSNLHVSGTTYFDTTGLTTTTTPAFRFLDGVSTPTDTTNIKSFYKEFRPTTTTSNTVVGDGTLLYPNITSASSAEFYASANLTLYTDDLSDLSSSEALTADLNVISIYSNTGTYNGVVKSSSAVLENAVAGGTIDKYVGFWANGLSADITHNGTTNYMYGFYMDNQSAGRSGNVPSTSNRYGVYIEDGGRNYFAGTVGIGTDTPSEKLEVSGKTKTTTLQITSGATNGYVLTSDASGNATWQATSGGCNCSSFSAITLTANTVSSEKIRGKLGPISINDTDLGNVYFGSTSGVTIDVPNRRIGIKTATPSYDLEVSGTTSTTNLRITSGATNGYVLTSDASGNGTWQASSGGVTIDPYNNIGSSGTSFTWNVSGLSTNYQVTLTANTTLNLSNVRNGDYGTLIVSQDAVGSRTITFGTVNGAATTHRVVNGGGGSPTLTANANAIDILTFTYNGSTMFWTVGNDYT